MKQMYWAVLPERSWGRFPKAFPQTLHKTAHAAKMEWLHKRDIERQFKRPRKYKVVRLLLETKDTVHYDIYYHAYEREKLSPLGKRRLASRRV